MVGQPEKRQGTHGPGYPAGVTSITSHLAHIYRQNLAESQSTLQGNKHSPATMQRHKTHTKHYPHESPSPPLLVRGRLESTHHIGKQGRERTQKIRQGSRHSPWTNRHPKQPEMGPRQAIVGNVQAPRLAEREHWILSNIRNLLPQWYLIRGTHTKGDYKSHQTMEGNGTARQQQWRHEATSPQIPLHRPHPVTAQEQLDECTGSWQFKAVHAAWDGGIRAELCMQIRVTEWVIGYATSGGYDGVVCCVLCVVCCARKGGRGVYIAELCSLRYSPFVTERPCIYFEYERFSHSHSPVQGAPWSHSHSPHTRPVTHPYDIHMGRATLQSSQHPSRTSSNEQSWVPRPTQDNRGIPLQQPPEVRMDRQRRATRGQARGHLNILGSTRPQDRGPIYPPLSGRTNSTGDQPMVWRPHPRSTQRLRHFRGILPQQSPTMETATT